MPIRIVTGKRGWVQLKASFKKNRNHYLQEALGLAIFMISACFFGAMQLLCLFFIPHGHHQVVLR
jgi:hypothetical protein